jgi:hypothetical protein
MAGKDRGNREARKPKKDKKPKPVTPTMGARPMAPAPTKDAGK